jgi:hypothetical protein
MLEFEVKKRVVTLVAKDGDIEVSVFPQNPWDRKKRREGDKQEWKVSVTFEDDECYNAVELTCETEEEAKMLAQDAVNFFKKVRPALKIKKEELDSED